MNVSLTNEVGLLQLDRHRRTSLINNGRDP